MNYTLSNRKKTLLNAIVTDYISHGEPLGSRTLCRRHGLSFSPATVRNEMAELEEYGLLFQPHTSAGRVPSHKGYRFFVDNLMAVYTPTLIDHQFVLRLQQTSKAVDAILAQGIQVLSEVTECIALAEAPYLKSSPVKSLHMTPIDEFSFVLHLTYGSGIQRQSLLRLSQPVYSETLNLLTNYLNAHLDNISLEALFHQIVTGPLEREIQHYKVMIMETISEIYAQAQRDEKLHLTGRSHLLKESGFLKMDEVYPILKFLEEEGGIRELLHRVGFQNSSSSVRCMIGYENPYEALHNCSVITTQYYIDEKASGTIGVVGPTRINYSKVTALLAAVAHGISQSLTDLFAELNRR